MLIFRKQQRYFNFILFFQNTNDHKAVQDLPSLAQHPPSRCSCIYRYLTPYAHSIEIATQTYKVRKYNRSPYSWILPSTSSEGPYRCCGSSRGDFFDIVPRTALLFCTVLVRWFHLALLVSSEMPKNFCTFLCVREAIRKWNKHLLRKKIKILINAAEMTEERQLKWRRRYTSGSGKPTSVVTSDKHQS